MSPPPSFSFLQSLTDMFNFSAGFLGVGLTRPKNHDPTRSRVSGIKGGHGISYLKVYARYSKEIRRELPALFNTQMRYIDYSMPNRFLTLSGNLAFLAIAALR